jgi:hypothetical protein
MTCSIQILHSYYCKKGLGFTTLIKYEMLMTTQADSASATTL